MAIRTTPIFVQAGTHPAEETRLMLGGMLGMPPTTFAGGVAASNPAHGIVSATDFAVTQNPTPNMTVLVGVGGAFIRGTENLNQGAYHVWNDAPQSVTINTAHPTLSRRDLIVVSVTDQAYSGGTSVASISVVTGTPGTGTDPTPPANALVLARVTVAALDAAINTADITDLRTLANQIGKLPSFATAVLRNQLIPAPYQGQTVHLNSDNTLYSYTGSAWVPAGSKVPQTKVKNTTLTGAGSTASTVYVNLPGASVSNLSITKLRGDTNLVCSVGVHNHYTSLADFTDIALRVNGVDYLASSIGVSGFVRRSQYGTIIVTGLAIGTYTVGARLRIQGGAGGTATFDGNCYYNITATETF